MKEVIQMISDFDKELTANKAVVKEKFQLEKPTVPAASLKSQAKLGRIEPTVLDFYKAADGLQISWKAVDPTLTKEDILGKTTINPYTKVIRDWSGVVFFDKDPMDSEVRKFFPLDFFADEAAVGYCTKEGWRNMMFLFKFEGELIPLDVNFRGYLELLLNAKATFYWQYLILEITEKKENPMSARIKKHLPKIFPDFSFAEFKKLFNKLKVV